MKCLIIDDDEDFCIKLKGVLVPYFNSIFQNVTIDIICKDFSNAYSTEGYDVFFLDIDLKEKSGIDIAKLIRVRKPEYNQIIIFISARNDLVFESFSVRPFHFVRKSNFNNDMKILLKLLNNYFKNTMKLVTFNYYGRKTSILQKDILYIETYGHNIAIITKENQYEYRSTMKEALELIGTNFVVQIQRSFAVSLMQIKEIDKDTVTLKNGKSFTIGRKYKETLLQKYKEFLLK